MPNSLNGQGNHCDGLNQLNVLNVFRVDRLGCCFQTKIRLSQHTGIVKSEEKKMKFEFHQIYFIESSFVSHKF